MRHPRDMLRDGKIRILFALLVLAVLLPGCGGNRIIINLDVDSFIPEDERSFDYILLPFQDDWEQNSPIEPVETPEGQREIVQLEDMSIRTTVRFDNSNVIGEVQMGFTLDVFVAGHDSVAVFWSEENRLLSLGGTLTGGEITEIEEEVDVASFLGLFQAHDRVYVGLALSLERDAGVGIVDGEALVTRLHLHVEARESLF